MNKFSIEKNGRGWWLRYPDDFHEVWLGEVCATFADAVACFVEASERQCITCGRGAVVDTATGWECKACGSYDTAVGTSGSDDA